MKNPAGHAVTHGLPLSFLIRFFRRLLLAGVLLAFFGHSDNGLDALDGSVDAVDIGCRDLNLALAVNLVNGDDCTGLLLDFLDDLSTLTDDGTDGPTAKTNT